MKTLLLKTIKQLGSDQLFTVNSNYYQIVNTFLSKIELDRPGHFKVGDMIVHKNSLKHGTGEHEHASESY